MNSKNSSTQPKYLITPSLYNAYYWYALRNYEDATTENFLKVLRKEETEKKPIMEEGIKFENDIHALCNTGDIDGGDTPIYQIARIVNGGFWQERVKKEFGDYLLYGICDVIKGDTIYDIKYCASYDDGKYDDSIQHLVYMYCTGIPKFQYLIGSKNRNQQEEIFIEEHSWNSESAGVLSGKIFDMISFLKGNKDFWKAFEEHWRVKDERYNKECNQ